MSPAMDIYDAITTAGSLDEMPPTLLQLTLQLRHYYAALPIKSCVTHFHPFIRLSRGLVAQLRQIVETLDVAQKVLVNNIT